MEQLFLVKKQICLLVCCWDSMQLISGIIFACFITKCSGKVLINQCIMENIVRFLDSLRDDTYVGEKWGRGERDILKGSSR